MTYQAPDRWRQQLRGPQHAAPFGSPAPLRVHARRALRLFAAAGAWAAGLCLIIASVVLVADAGGAGRATHVTATAGRYRLGPGQLGGRAGGRPGATTRPAGGAGVVLRTFAGTGDRTTSQFTVAAASRWELRWSYWCAATAPRGHLVIRDGNAADGGVTVDAAGPAGHGSTWTYSDAATHYLVVITNCAWTAQVVGRK